MAKRTKEGLTIHLCSVPALANNSQLTSGPSMFQEMLQVVKKFSAVAAN